MTATPDVKWRVCTKCGEKRPLTDFPVYKNHKGDRVQVGRRHECLLCLRQRQNAWRHKHVSQIKPIVPEVRRCPKCGEYKPAEAFSKSSRDGLQTYCKDCCRLARAANSDAEIQRVLKWQREHPELHAVKQARWNARHIKQVRQGKRRRENVRRTRQTQAGGSFTQAEWERLCAAHDNRCARCGERKPLTVDHIVPIILGGTSDITNLQPLCQSCNSRKASRIRDYRHAY